MMLLISASALYLHFSGALDQMSRGFSGSRRGARGLEAGMVAAGLVAIIIAVTLLRGRRRAKTSESAQIQAREHVWDPRSSTDPVIFRRSPFLLFALSLPVMLVAAVCVLGTLATWATGLSEGWAGDTQHSTLLGVLVGPLMVAVVAGLLGVVLPAGLRGRGPVLVIDAEGLSLNVSGCRIGRVAWDEVLRIDDFRDTHGHYLKVTVTDPVTVAERSHDPIVEMNRKAYGSPVAFQLHRIRGWRRKLVPALQRHAPLQHVERLTFTRRSR